MHGRRVGSVRPGKYTQKRFHLAEIDDSRAKSRQKSGFGALFGRIGPPDTGPVAPGLALMMVEACEPPEVGRRCGRGPTSRMWCGGWCWIFPAGDIRWVGVPSRPISFRDDDVG